MYSTIHLIIYIKTLGESLSACCDDSARWRCSVLVVSEVALSGSCGESLSDSVSTWHKNKLHRRGEGEVEGGGGGGQDRVKKWRTS